jgi:hypothetical protein
MARDVIERRMHTRVEAPDDGSRDGRHYLNFMVRDVGTTAEEVDTAADAAAMESRHRATRSLVWDLGGLRATCG